MPTVANADSAAKSLGEFVARQQWEEAEKHLSAALISHPNDPDVLTTAALVNAKQGRLVEASQLMVDAVVASGYDTSKARIDNAVRALLDVGRLYDAIDLLQRVVESKPAEAKYRRMLIGFLGEAQLLKDQERHMQRLIRDREFDISLLIATTETFSRRFSYHTIELILERNPQDRRPALGLAQQKIDEHDFDGAHTILQDILQTHPNFPPAYAMMAQVLAEQGRHSDLGRWLDQAPSEAGEYSDYWLALGNWAMEEENLPGAAKAFGTATQLSPSNSLAWTKLASALKRLELDVDLRERWGTTFTQWLESQAEFPVLVEAIENRIDNILALRKRFHEFSGTSKRSQRAAVAVAEKLLDLGRTWEAEAWSAIATTLTQDLAPELIEQRQEILVALAECPKWINDERFIELRLDFSALPQSRVVAGEEEKKTVASNLTRIAAGTNSRRVRLADEAKQRGVDFYGEVGDQVSGPRVPLTQSVGCGGASIDYDQDGLCDLILAAAGGTAHLQDSQAAAVYRNVNGMFVDVTASSGAADRGFGQGIAAGDYNDDGFQDLYFLNLGKNQLYRNNGDGTFANVTKECFPHLAGTWSTSGAIVDVDGDGWNDLVSVNYCDSNQPIDKPCHDKKTNALITCSPMQFMGGRDEFFQGNGDGTFSDVSSAWTRQPSPGRGLGIIAGSLDGKRMGLYIANDMSANDYYVGDSSGQSFRLAEIATTSGIAVDAQTQTQASMGVATGDLDNDGDLDIYVTGFSGEYNIYYEQVAPGYWTDKTASLRLAKPTLSMVGFGTVASDFDGDGIEELFVTNGNVGDFGDSSPPYAMPFQWFRRSSEGLFTEESVAEWGTYFSTPHIGRAMWMLDADTDGRSDLVVTHQTEPVSLLMNRSDSGNHHIGFRLVGTTHSRDAIGAVVRFEVQRGSQLLTKTLFAIAGGGFLCSNEPTLRCGTGQAAEVQNVSVLWPSGQTQMVGNLTSDCEYLLIEGQRDAYKLRSF